jgi:electron transfer flavoprotein alpha subunit
VANILVLIELRDGSALPVSLEALGQARRISTALGATLYALLPLPEAPAYGEDDLIARCARHGADKVVLLSDEPLSMEAEMRFGTHGPAVLAACEQFPPALVILGATPGARDLAPRLAARLGAVYLPEGSFATEGPRLRLRDWAGRLIADDEGCLEHPVVLTVPPGRYAPSLGEDEAEMVIVASPETDRDAGFIEVGREAVRRVLVVGEDAAAQALRQALPPADPARVPPALVISRSAAPTDWPGALRVALGADAADAGEAHYVIEAIDEEGVRALCEALGQGDAQ